MNAANAAEVPISPQNKTGSGLSTESNAVDVGAVGDQSQEDGVSAQGEMGAAVGQE